MAKGDSGEMNDMIKQQQSQDQAALNVNNARTAGQYNNMYNNYNAGVTRNMNDYGGIMGGYNTFLSGGNPGMTGSYSPQYGNVNTMPVGQPVQPGNTIMPKPGTQMPTGGTGGRNGTGLPTYGTATAKVGTQPVARTTINDSGLTGGYGASQPGQVSPQFGNVSDPSTWMNLVGNDQQRVAFARSILPSNAPDQLVNYYADKIKQQPGANPTEQAGSAQYWADKAAKDPAWGGNAGSSGSSGGPSAIGAWQDAISTGMITPQQIQDLRARAVAPIRAAYQQAQDNVERQRALSGGYSPGYNATQAKLAREQGYGMSDAETNANASIVQAIQSGKLAGAQGLTGAQLGALAGQTGLYGAQPGLASTFGNQVLGTNQQNLQGQSLQNELSQILLNSKLGQAKIPSDYQQALGNIGGTIGLAGDVANAWSGFGSPKVLPSTQTVPNYNYQGLMPGLTGGYGLS